MHTDLQKDRTGQKAHDGLGDTSQGHGPGRIGQIACNRFSMDKQVKEVQVRLKPMNFLLANYPVKKVAFHQPGDKMVDFNLKTVSKQG